ncbi:MAG: dipicolinate synthase subunit B [Oscillospiraceae bacterium]|jgi:dipicolinate synthase subunit B|nr:dipicolinate synthase subunit B [Oscillospiraceae bacterium]
MRIGWAFCGSFCTFERALGVLKALVLTGEEVTPVFSEAACQTDTRFGKAADWVFKAEEITGRAAIRTIAQAEPIGPKGLLDLLIVAPATGNTLAKLAHGITDGTVTMACKSHLRNGRPLLLALSTNDGLSGSAPNIAALMSRKHVYFVPYRQDDAAGKPASLVAGMEMIPELIPQILQGVQPQPVLLPA